MEMCGLRAVPSMSSISSDLQFCKSRISPAQILYLELQVGQSTQDGNLSKKRAAIEPMDCRGFGGSSVGITERSWWEPPIYKTKTGAVACTK